MRYSGSIPGFGKILLRRAWQLNLVFLPGESHGQRSLVDYGPWGHKESDTTEVTEHTCKHNGLKWQKGNIHYLFSMSVIPSVMVTKEETS